MLFYFPVLNLQRLFSTRIVAGKLLEARYRNVSSAAAASELKAVKGDETGNLNNNVPPGKPKVPGSSKFVKSKNLHNSHYPHF